MRKLALTLLLAVSLAIPGCLGQDTDEDGISDADEASLAERFAPVLRLVPGENYFPVAVEFGIENSELKRSVGGDYYSVETSPTAQSISSFRDPESQHFLDNVHGGIDDDGIKDQFKSVEDDTQPTVYARVTPADPYTIVQYWFYYVFNDGNLNSHEGDWEMIQIQLYNEDPVSTGYSQHFWGQSAEWDEVLVRDDEHPVVYVAKGSHANYYRSYQGVLGIQSDVVSGSGEALTPDDYDLVVLGERDLAFPGQAWLSFAGRWGEWGEAEDQLRGRRGPPGPGMGDNAEKWDSPAMWQEDLHGLSTNWLWLSWVVANFAILFLIYLALRGAWTFMGLLRAIRERTAFKGLRIGAIVAIIGATIALAAVWQPWYFMDLDVQSGDYKTDGAVTVMEFDGVQGLQINDPQSNRGLVSMFTVRFPIGLILLSALVFLVLDSVKAKSPGDLRSPLIRKGIMRLILPVVPIIIIIALLGSVVSTVASEMVDGELPEPVQDMIDSLSSSPVGGTFDGEITHLGEVKLAWGLGIGSYLMLLGGFLQLAGGFLSSGRVVE
jgi:hypothetical protein